MLPEGGETAARGGTRGVRRRHSRASGERSHLVSSEVDLDLQITDVVNVLHYEDLRDVILVGHSYGGMVITGVADRAADRVGKLVYLDAANPANGQSLVDVAGPMIEATRPLGKVVDGVELVLFPGTDPLGYYGVTDPEDLALDAGPAHTASRGSRFEQPLRSDERSGAVGHPPVPHRLHVDARERDDFELMANVRAEGRLWTVDTGHDLMISEPKKVTDALLESWPCEPAFAEWPRCGRGGSGGSHGAATEVERTGGEDGRNRQEELRVT